MNDAEIHAIAVSIDYGNWFDNTQDMLKFAHLLLKAESSMGNSHESNMGKSHITESPENRVFEQNEIQSKLAKTEHDLFHANAKIESMTKVKNFIEWGGL